MTAVLSCHVQTFVAMTVLELGCEQNEISVNFKLRWKNISKMVLSSLIALSHSELQFQTATE